MEVSWYSQLILIISICFIFKLFFLKKKNLPPGPPALPIVGHLHLLKKPIHRILHNLSNQHGPVLYLRFGIQPVVVLSSSAAAERCFTDNDITLANRPKSLFSKYTSYNRTSIVFSPYGDHWRNLRRIATTQVFSPTSLQLSSAVRNEETRFLAGKLFRASNGETQKVNLNSVFTDFVFNVMMTMIAGKRWSPVDDLFAVGTILGICDYVPLLRWIGFRGMEKEVVKLARKRDEFLQELVDESRQKKISGCFTKQRKTVIDALLSLKEADPGFYTEDIIKGIISVLITGGTYTSAITMEWAMSLLLNHPEILQKARAEIENHVKPGQLVDDTVLPKLPYLQCIIKETLRLFPVAPILLPHFSSEDCVIEGYNIPRGTTVFVNAWAIQRDPNLWDEPNKFKPERFLGMKGERDRGLKFLPFGVGRRKCPGDILAMQVLGLALGALIQCFELERVGPELVDLTEGTGSGLPKAEPLEALYRPRPSMTKVLSQLILV